MTNRFAHAINVVVIALSLFAIAVFVYLACRRVWYPYELEWLENGMVEHVRRLLSGHTIYTKPSIDFVTFPYPPVTTLAGAAISWPFGAHFWELRLISALASMGSFALVVHIVYTETRRWMPAIAAAGIYAASYQLCGAWFDVGKPDALFLFLCVVGIALLRDNPSIKRVAIGGLILGLAIMTKQTAILLALAIGSHMLITLRWRALLTSAVTTVVTVGAISAIFMATSGHWYSFFVWDLLREHNEITQSRWLFISQDLHPLWLGALLVLAALPYWLRRTELSKTYFYASVAAALIVGAWVSRLHVGGYLNVLMPAVLAIALLAGISAGRIMDFRRRTTALAAVGIVLILQLASLRYDISDQVPTAAQRNGIAGAITTLKGIDGDVLVLAHPTYGVLAGKPSHASLGGIADIQRGTNKEASDALNASIAAAIREQRFAAIALDAPSNRYSLPGDWQRYYVQSSQPLVPAGAARSPITGWGVPPVELWVRTNPAE